MNEHLSEIKAVDRAVTRAPTPVAAVQPVKPQEKAAPERTVVAQPVAKPAVDVDSEVAGAAEYAKAHARIADILADMRSTPSVTVDGAAAEIQSMIPQPIVIVPLPPASKEAVEHAEAMARRIAQQALHAQAAQANVKRGTVDQILSTVV
jgi:hypothetical protein